MTTQILDGTGTMRTVANLDDFMAANPTGAQPVNLSKAVAPPTTIDSTKTRVTSVASVNNTLVSAPARVVRSLDIYNEASYTVYFKLYDKATAPAAGTDTPFWTIPLPANSGYSRQFIWGIPVTLGLGFAITRNKVDTDTTAIAAGDVVGLMTWR